MRCRTGMGVNCKRDFQSEKGARGQRTAAALVGFLVPALAARRGHRAPVAGGTDEGVLQVVLAVAANPNVVVSLVSFASLAPLVVRPVNARPVGVVGHHVLGVWVPERRHPLRVVRQRDPALGVVAAAHAGCGAAEPVTRQLHVSVRVLGADGAVAVNPHPGDLSDVRAGERGGHPPALHPRVLLPVRRLQVERDTARDGDRLAVVCG